MKIVKQIAVPSPVIALAVTDEGLLAAGFGGVARLAGEEWVLLAEVPLRSVTALAVSEGVLLAGGDGGLARSGDGGRSWQRCAAPEVEGPVSSLVLSPCFADDGVALAATVDAGVLRSSDGGWSWTEANFGLPSWHVLALAWTDGETVVAATAAGLARSPNEGRAWRLIEAAPAGEYGALARLASGEVLAAPAEGPPLRSAGTLAQWSEVPGLPDAIRVSAMHVTGDRIVLGSENAGLLRSTNDGETWSQVSTVGVLCLAADERQMWLGTADGVWRSTDGGTTWDSIAPPPLHDLRRLLVVAGRPLLVGLHSAPLIAEGDGWVELESAPRPLATLADAPDGALLASSPAGLWRSADHGQTWQEVVAGPAGSVTQITFSPEGTGWAGIADGALLRSGDGGRNWERRDAPFGVLPLVALQVATGMLLAATYDARQRAISLWRSEDDGAHWTRGGDAIVSWPLVAMCGEPLTVIVGSTIAVRQVDGSWRQATVGATGFRRVVSNGETLFALAVDALWRSDDMGASWVRDDAGIAGDELLDVAWDGEVLYALSRGGRVTWREVGCPRVGGQRR